MQRKSVENGEGKAMKTPVVIGIVVALHIAALGTLMMTQGCGTAKGAKGGPVAFEDKPVVIPKPVAKDVMPREVAKPRPPKPFVPVEEVEEGDVIGPKPVPVPAPVPAPAIKKDKPAAPETKNYTVKKGDSLSYIAQRFKVTQGEIKELNPSVKNANKLKEGQELKLPARVDLKAPAPKRRIKPKPVVKPVEEMKLDAAGGAPAPTVSGGEYVVQNGDYPEKIAKKCGVKLDDLMKANKITDPKKLKIGQKLVVPGAPAVAPAGGLPLMPVEPAPIAPLSPLDATPAGRTVAPAVPPAPGGIVEPAGELKPNAPLAPAPAAPAGLKPLVPAAPAAGAPAPALKNMAMKHTVAPGETLKDIAMLYTVTVADIMKANGLTSEAVTPGQSLNIPPVQ